MKKLSFFLFLQNCVDGELKYFILIGGGVVGVGVHSKYFSSTFHDNNNYIGLDKCNGRSFGGCFVIFSFCVGGVESEIINKI